MKISLHLGAHKTATTYIQQVLRRNIAYLAQRRVLYIPLNETREGFTDAASKPVRKPMRMLKRYRTKRRCSAFLKKHLTIPPDSDLSPYRRLILSDENLIGSPSRTVRSGEIYNQAHKRLAELRLHLASYEVEIFFAIRQQGSFASSIFAEAIGQDSPFHLDDQAFRKKWLRNRPSWVPTVQTLANTFPNATIYLWDFEALSEIEDEIFSLLAGTDDLLHLSRKLNPIRQSLSQRTIELLLEVQAKNGPAARSKHRREFRLAHPRNALNPAYTLWTPEELQTFDVDFAKDLEAFANMGPQIQLLTSLQGKKA